MKTFACLLLAGTPLFSAASALSPPSGLTACAGVSDDAQRLACYDRLAGRSSSLPAPTENAAPETATAESKPAQAASDSRLSRDWELAPQDKHGRFAFRPHNDNYILLANYTFAPNPRPFAEYTSLAPPGSKLSHTELDFQLSFKLKLLQEIAGTPADLWFGYTQQSFWQAYNSKASSPFRETDYQPEVMAVLPADYHFLGLHGRFVNLGFVHQSNGQSSSLSRSWNRFYLQTGLERGNFTLLARAWKRVNENLSDDDNPDIVDFMGYGDLRAIYRRNGSRFSMLLRQNFRTDRGGVQLGWAFPLSKGVKGYVQLFSGYGQSLIDYNYSQKSIGFGVLIGD